MQDFSAAKLNETVDRVYADLMQKLGVEGSGEALMISHWQDELCNFRIMVRRKSDGKTLTRCAHADGRITL